MISLIFFALLPYLVIMTLRLCVIHYVNMLCFPTFLGDAALSNVMSDVMLESDLVSFSMSAVTLVHTQSSCSFEDVCFNTVQYILIYITLSQQMIFGQKAPYSTWSSFWG